MRSIANERQRSNATSCRQWRENDNTAARAVEALNRGVLDRRWRGRTAIEAGISDWLLYEDPDLEQLRSHPRFVRWASALWDLEYPDDTMSRLQTLVLDETNVPDLEPASACRPERTNGARTRGWSRTEVLTRGANGWLTAHSFGSLAADVAAAWEQVLRDQNFDQHDLRRRYVADAYAVGTAVRVSDGCQAFPWNGRRRG